MAAKTRKTFSYGALLRSLHAGTFRSHASPELELVQRHEARYGAPPGDAKHCARLSLKKVFGSGSRALVEDSTAGFLTGTSIGQYLPALQARSVVMRLGARKLPASKSNVTLPRGATTATTSHQSGETTLITESENTYGQIAATPKLMTIYSKVSRQALIQSNIGQIMELEQTAAAGTAMDAAVIAGTGINGQPLGILNTAQATTDPATVFGVNSFTGYSGGTLTYANLIAGQQAVADANAILNPSALGFITTPTVAGLLKQRYRISTYGEWPLWNGPLSNGDIEGVPAYATKNIPAGSMIYGDFSTVQVFMWDDISIEVDPYSNFTQALVGIRLILPYDVVLTYPQSFAVATGIT
jgi:HK97 family phage major capsid protein